MTDQAVLPRRFGRYALFDFIGRGGMAEIYLARAEAEFGAARLCVLKEILPAFASEASFAEMLIFEAKLAARLSHANIVQVFDLGRFEDRLYIAMEYVEGYDLSALLRHCTEKRVPLPLPFALHIVGEALRGLDYAHRAKDDDGAALGVVHRDVSPSNILISRDGEIKLCDFGIAHANDLVADADAGADRAQIGDADQLRGKAGYMSPEHARGEALDARADVFATGIVLWELLAGKRMYRAEEGLSLLDVARRASVPELPTRGLPEEAQLRAVVAKALAIAPADRYASAALMRADLDAYLSSAKLTQSAIRFGDWLTESFGDEAFRLRRAKEQTLTPAPVAPARPLTLTDEVEAENPRSLPAVGARPASASSQPQSPAAAQAQAEALEAQEVTEPLGAAHFRAVLGGAVLGGSDTRKADEKVEAPLAVAAPPTAAALLEAELARGAGTARIENVGEGASNAESTQPNAESVDIPPYRGPLQSKGAMRAFRKNLHPNAEESGTGKGEASTVLARAGRDTPDSSAVRISDVTPLPKDGDTADGDTAAGLSARKLKIGIQIVIALLIALAIFAYWRQ